jgi:hypothetical protein
MDVRGGEGVKGLLLMSVYKSRVNSGMRNGNVAHRGEVIKAVWSAFLFSWEGVSVLSVCALTCLMGTCGFC